MTNSFRLGPDGIYRCDAFQQFVWQEHGFGTRSASPRADVTLKQIHSDRVVNAAGLGDREQEGDALVTNQTGFAIGVRSADCVPILLLDSRKHAAAAIHAGWRGSADHILQKAVQQMRDAFGTDPADLYAAIGPCIRGACYEVSPEVAARFSAQFPEWAEEEQALRRCIELAEANRRQLLKSGVREDRIFDSCLCTSCDAVQFFSYRREPENPGRMVSAIQVLA